ncbi:hypothetical protein IU438_18540 [Nocardia cyriacigeorgica]|uniref:Uncharacterized protein n=1 Tax=Nocardia cyriacigeorgica TaxID=135487 RepID=A0A2L2JKV6_9NOCA|nr:hypothetical protein [Nocardia cyriacigeorgica]AVH20501.1 hypothetical protein C5B73_02455 [Nocardia cyriacigeorgica]MBF6090345.1 hypothetical protein [Nocardia cyriacigeorgica]MBF6096186.1 hypothetical protein [Nocardia cyriacigeorgica]MBF6319661.1 hypothetical protein [Nocardia cyriacigeorgica]MBF6326238.1 hypothetical protein [Nocardia cyriacigeorgica]
MSFTKLLGAGVAALALGTVLTAGPAIAEPLPVTPMVTPVVAPGEPAPGGASSGSAVLSLIDRLMCGSSITCPY